MINPEHFYKLLKDNGIEFNKSYKMYMYSDLIGKQYIKTESGRAEAKEFIPRPIMIPGNIGGHCVMQNLEFLKDLMPEFYEYIKKFSRLEEWVKNWK